MDLIDAYIAELDAALRGPGRARADLPSETELVQSRRTALLCLCLLLTLFHPQPGLLPSWPLFTVALPLPMLFVALSGQRCLRTREARS